MSALFYFVQGKHGRKLVLPHQIECHMTLEKGLLAYLLDAYHEKPTAKENHHRMVNIFTRSPFVDSIIIFL